MKRAERLRLDVNPAFAIAAAALYLFDNDGVFALIAVSALVHELGHYIVLRLLGTAPHVIRLELTGAVMYYDGRAMGYGGELAAAAAGPAAGALLGALAAICGDTALCGASLTLTAFNLLPANGLDGGKMLHSLLALLLDGDRADKVSDILTIFTAAALILCGGAAFIGIRCGAALILAGAALLIRQLKGGR